MNTLTTFIPAGGIGSRLRPHTLDIPKPLLLMGSADRRIIDWPLEASRAFCDQVWVSSDYQANQLRDYLDNLTGVETLQDPGTIGSGGSLVAHYGTISDLGVSDDLLILPSDHIYKGFSIEEYWKAHKESDADITLLTVPPKSYGEYVLVESGFAKSIERAYVPGVLSTTGIFMLKNKFILEWLRKYRLSEGSTCQPNIYRDIICPSVGAVAVSSYFMGPETGYWQDTGTINRYLDSNMRISNGQNVVSGASIVDPSSNLERCVVLGESIIGADIVLKDAIISMRNGRLVVSKLGGETYVEKSQQ